MKLGVLQFIIAWSKSKPPRRITVQPGDDYLLFLLARWYAVMTDRPIQVLKWTKARDSVVRATLEDASLVGPSPIFVVLGAPTGWERVETLTVTHDGSLAIIEQKDGHLIPEKFQAKSIRSLLAVLTKIKEPFDVRDVARCPWGWAKSWADCEPPITKMLLLGRTRPEAPLDETIPRGPLLGFVREGDLASLVTLARRYSYEWLFRAVTEETVRCAMMRVHLDRELDPWRIKGMFEDWSWRDEGRLEEASEWPLSQLAKLGDALVEADRDVLRNPDHALLRLMYGSPFPG